MSRSSIDQRDCPPQKKTRGRSDKVFNWNGTQSTGTLAECIPVSWCSRGWWWSLGDCDQRRCACPGTVASSAGVQHPHPAQHSSPPWPTGGRTAPAIIKIWWAHSWDGSNSSESVRAGAYKSAAPEVSARTKICPQIWRVGKFLRPRKTYHSHFGLRVGKVFEEIPSVDRPVEHYLLQADGHFLQGQKQRL